MRDTKYLEIIKAPVITEKSMADKENGKYTFKVDPRANKIEIKNAIEKIFNVKVTSIRTLNVKPKKRRVGRYTGLTNRTKKAIVTLAEGQTIDLG
ncbi:MAG: 50S ribosomal protein L23 [bacterium]|nr:50S ribosomal protein L23 [Mycoplasmatota bacterium]MDD6757331.1 50S ribosomal protein L23 [bacterium]MDY2908425.1 50S ribosomal protein L23 [Candidatus Faecimonas sp.]